MAPAKGAGAALFDALPDVLQLDFDELPAWLCRATEAIRDELTLRRPGFRSVALRQAELIVIQLIRHYIAAHTPRLPAWISLPRIHAWRWPCANSIATSPGHGRWTCWPAPPAPRARA